MTARVSCQKKIQLVSTSDVSDLTKRTNEIYTIYNWNFTDIIEDIISMKSKACSVSISQLKNCGHTSVHPNSKSTLLLYHPYVIDASERLTTLSNF